MVKGVCDCELSNAQKMCSCPFRNVSFSEGFDCNCRSAVPLCRADVRFQRTCNRTGGICPGWEQSEKALPLPDLPKEPSLNVP